jgi:hypothetical protein
MNILDQILLLAQVAEKIGTSEQNIQDLINRKRIPEYLFTYLKAENKSRGVYIFNKEFLEYYEIKLKK